MYLKKSDIWRHPDYNHRTFENNFALVFLPNSIDDIEPVKLDSASSFDLGEMFNTFGWGSIEQGGPPSNLPRITTAGYVPNDMCISPEFDITDDMMCANPSEGLGPCDFDWVSWAGGATTLGPP